MPAGHLKRLVLAFLAGYGFIALVSLGTGHAITAHGHLRALQWGAVCLFAGFTFFKIAHFLYRKPWYRRTLETPLLGPYIKLMAILPVIAPMAATVLMAENPDGSLWPLGVVVGMMASCFLVQEKILENAKKEPDSSSTPAP